eukprot:442498-Amphidinium_carterae.1
MAAKYAQQVLCVHQFPLDIFLLDHTGNLRQWKSHGDVTYIALRLRCLWLSDPIKTHNESAWTLICFEATVGRSVSVSKTLQAKLSV